MLLHYSFILEPAQTFNNNTQQSFCSLTTAEKVTDLLKYLKINELTSAWWETASCPVWRQKKVMFNLKELGFKSLM